MGTKKTLSIIAGVCFFIAGICFFMAGINTGVFSPVAWGLLALVIGLAFSNMPIPTPYDEDPR